LALLHYSRIVVVDEDLLAPGSTFNDAERRQAHGDLFEYASLVEQVNLLFCHKALVWGSLHSSHILLQPQHQ